MMRSLARAMMATGLISLGLMAPPLVCLAHADPAAAQKLFEEAIELRGAGRWPEACRKFAASMKLDPSVGTLLNVAKCHEREGKLATALGEYERGRVMNRGTPDAVRKAAIEEHISSEMSALKPRVPMLAITVEPMLDGLEIMRGEHALPVEALGEELPVDPGDVVVRATAPSHQGQARIQLAEGDRKTIHVTLSEVERPADPPPDRPITPVTADDGGVPVWAWISGGIGLAFAGAAIGTAVWYGTTVGKIKDRCGGELVPCTPDPPDSYDPEDDNGTKNLASGLTIGFGVGAGVGIVTAIVGIVTAGSDDAAAGGLRWRVVAQPGSVGVHAGAAF
jgi:hypothetical protein